MKQPRRFSETQHPAAFSAGAASSSASSKPRPKEGDALDRARAAGPHPARPWCAVGHPEPQDSRLSVEGAPAGPSCCRVPQSLFPGAGVGQSGHFCMHGQMSSIASQSPGGVRQGRGCEPPSPTAACTLGQSPPRPALVPACCQEVRCPPCTSADHTADAVREKAQECVQ